MGTDNEKKEEKGENIAFFLVERMGDSKENKKSCVLGKKNEYLSSFILTKKRKTKKMPEALPKKKAIFIHDFFILT